jgi:tetratricopeptide (TPR) repeat protein
MAGLEQARQGGRIAATISDAIGDLGAAALNLTGFSPHPQPGGQLNVERDGKSLDLLEQAVAELPESDEVVPVLEIELEWLTGSFRPSDASLKKATSLLEQAIKSSKANVSAMATAIFLRRFGRVVPPERWIELTRTAVTVQTTIRERLMLAFLEHRALLEIGLDEQAERLIRTVAGDSERVGNQADAGAARTLAIRHHLWIGDLHSAARLLNDGPSDDPDRRHDGGHLVTVDVEQRAELGRLLARNNLLDAVMEELGQSPVDPATGAALLSQAGRYEQAADLLEQAVEDLSTGREQPVDAATMARIAVAANVLFHEQAAAAVVEPLQRLGDELLVTNNSAVLLGPASYYAGLAAHTIGRHRQANEALDSAVVASLSKGGKPMAIQTLVAQAKLAADCTERDDVESLLRQAKELAVGLDIHWLDVQVV